MDLKKPTIISHSPRMGNPKKGGTGILKSKKHSFTIDSTPHLVAFGQTSSTSTQVKSTRKDSQKQSFREQTSEQLTLDKSLASTYSVRAFHARLSRLLESGKGLEIREARFFLKLLALSKPKDQDLFCLKTSKGFYPTMKGELSLSVLDELRYWVEWQVLNSKDFGVPQNRERVFIVGHLRGKSSKQIFPIQKGGQEVVERRGRVQEQIASAVFASQHKIARGMTMIELTESENQGQRVYSSKGIAKTLAGEAGGQGAKTGLYAISSSGRFWGREGRVKVGEANTINTGKGGDAQSSFTRVIQKQKIRRLTPTECERLQGFSDNFTEGLSDTQRYKCLGNAVTTNVITAIGEKLIANLQEKT